ncbi:MAG: phospholipase D-like domain-containing protein [Nanoarchaeota archaeon]|nr:phospholipase D-like domain-containing protein [Nanoarchaeota archaeon]
MKNFSIMSEPAKIYPEMLRDIANAKNYVYLETHQFDADAIGEKFKNLLIKKAKQGVKVRLLIDGYGSNAKKPYFNGLIKAGGEFKIFKEITSIFFGFRKNNDRNHRKLLLIDDKISYVGSMNITASGISYRELVLRLTGNITKILVHSFNKIWNLYGKITPKKLKSLLHKNFEIIQDIPSYYFLATENKYKKLIKSAKKSILIETPYFVPSKRILISLIKASREGVNISIIIPYDSEIKLVNLVKERYLGRLYRNGINIYMYKRSLLHAKLLIIDDKFFMFGTSNVDYRSFFSQFEINFIGHDKEIIKGLKKHFGETMIKTEPFDYQEWRKRSSWRKLLELILLRIRHFL